MKYMRYLMALAILSAMMGWAYATTVDMPGGTISKNENGATVEGYAKFSYDANSLSADMYAKANAIGEGNAYINMNRPTEASKVDSGKEVTAKGTIEAKVDGKSSDAKVTSVGWIHSDTRKDSNKISGNAFIYSGIGKTFSLDNGLTGIPEGKFEASANADGKATYSIDKGQIKGAVEGSTTIEGAVEGGSIGGNLDGNSYTLKGPAYSEISTSSSSNRILLGLGWSNKSESKNIIEVAAINDPCVPPGGRAYVSGTADGSASSSASISTEKCDPITGNCDRKIYGASTSKDDSMSADVRVLKSGDAAEAKAMVDVSATYTSRLGVTSSSAANSEVLTHAQAKRIDADNDKTDASHRTYGEAFVSKGSWQATANYLESHRDGESGEWTETLYNNAAVSGSFGKNKEPLANGIGSGTFLLNSKNGLAWANMSLTQTADEDGTTMGITADIMGPRAASLGSWTWDGSGVYGYFDDLHVERTIPLATPSSVRTLSTDIADVNSYLWVDGTNDAMFNGPGFESVTPIFDPSSSGSFTGVTWDFTPSPTQRQTTVTMGTSQS